MRHLIAPFMSNDPIGLMEAAARRQLPSLAQQGIYLWQEPAIIGGAATAVAAVAWWLGAPVWLPIAVAALSIILGAIWVFTR